MPRFGTKLDAATPGLSKLAAALGGGQQAYQQGFDESALTQSKLAQALSQIRFHDAGAAQTNAETSVLQSRPGAVDEAAAMQSGSTLPMVKAVQDYVRTGVRPMRDLQGPVDEAGNGPGQAPVVDDAQQSAISLALQRLLPMRTNLKDTNVEDAAKASGLYREQDLSDKVIAGQLPRNAVAGAQAAVGAKPLFHAGENGAVLDQYAGGLDTSNPMAGASIGLRNQQAAQAKAGAAENYAQAAHANAQTAMTRQQIEQGVKSGMLKLDKDADGNIIVVDLQHRTIETPKDKDTGLPVKPATKGANLSEGERKAATLLTRLRGSQAQLQQALLDDPSAAKPDSMAEMARMVPVIGGDTPANSIMSGGRQRVENAQLDMLDAALTLGTGAAYTKEQLRGYARSYFPQIGDDQPTIADKQDRLQSVIRAAEIAAGRAEPLAPKFPTPTAPSVPKPNARTPMGAPPGSPQQVVPPNGRPPLSSFQR